MRIQNVTILLLVIAMAWLFLSNASGVPQGVTHAPEEASHNSCATCHTPVGNYMPTIILEVTDVNQAPVNKYTPGQTYNLKVKVSAQNNPKSFGFQMVCLDSLTNSDRGNWLEMGEKVRVQNLTIKQKPRKYLVQSAPKADGIFLTKWKAPDTDVGPIKFYFAGLAVNLNGNTSGDNHVTGNITFGSPTSSIGSDLSDNVYNIYPNPTDGIIHVPSISEYVQITGLDGVIYGFACENGQININNFKSGAYVVRCFDQNGQTITSKNILKY